MFINYKEGQEMLDCSNQRPVQQRLKIFRPEITILMR